MYTQRDEEKYILEVFEKSPPGRFYDIGAYEGRTFSTTRALMERGWSGVCVEPSLNFKRLMDNIAAFPGVQAVNAAVTGKEAGLVKFYDAGDDCVGTLDESHRKQWEPVTGAMRPFWTNALPIEELFRTFGPAEFISLDVEGKNWELFQRLPFKSKELKLICVEFQRQDRQMLKIADGYGFRLLHRTEENLLLVR